MSNKQGYIYTTFLFTFFIFAGSIVLGVSPATTYNASVSNVVTNEGDPLPLTTAVEVTVTLDQPVATGQSATVWLKTNGGTATPLIDYIPILIKRVRFQAGDQSKTVDVNVVNDKHVEDDETIGVELVNPSANVNITQDQADVRIRDNDQVDVMVFKKVVDGDTPLSEIENCKSEEEDLEPCREYLYVGTFVNNGPGNLWGDDPIQVVDRLSPKVEFIDASPGGVYDPVEHTITWSFNFSFQSPWDTGQSRVGWIRFRVMDGVEQGERIVNNLRAILPDYYRFINHQNFMVDPDMENNHFRHRICYTIDQTLVKGFVFCDANGDGEQNNGEKGISNVVLNLLDNSVPEPAVIAKALTDHAGYYRFRNAVAGEYVVQIDKESLPEGAVCSTEGESIDVAIELCQCQTVHFGYKNLECAETFVAGKGAEGPQCDDEKDSNDLEFLEGTQTFGGKDYSWCNMVDGDLEGWDGTTLARGNENPADPAWAIFQFADEGKYKFNYIRLLTDNGTDDNTQKYPQQVLALEVLTSTTGMADEDFTSLGQFDRKSDGTEFEWHRLSDYVQAKYIKVKLLTPNHYPGNWRQIVEFEVQDGAIKHGASPASLQKFALSALPETTQLFNAYPNPFNPQTTLEYDLEMDANVSVAVFDINGRKVAELVDDYQFAGHHQVVWNAVSYASGNYFVTFKSGQTIQTIKIVLLK